MIPADTLSTIYTLLADNNFNNAPPSLITELYDLLPSIAVIDPENYLSHREYLESLTRHIEHLLTHAATSKISIGIGGGFSTGKSRFINTLLNLDILPEAIEPCTAVATYLTHSESDHTEALNIFNLTVNIEQQQLKQLRHFIGDDSENILHISQLIKHVIIHSQQIKWQNISFLDTPGYSKADAKNSIVNDENLALAQLSSVDHIIWLVSAKNGMIRDDDIKFLHQINHRNPVFVVVTQADLVSQKDISPIMQGVQQSLEKNNIAIAGLMAWAAPVYESKGKQVAGNDIRIWLDKLNTEESDTYLSDFIDCCQKLLQLASDKTAKLMKDNQNNHLFKSVHETQSLIEVLNTEQKIIINFMNKVISLARNNNSFDWSLASLYESNKLEGNLEAAIAIYHKKANSNPDKAIKNLDRIVFGNKKIEAIVALADIYEKILNDIEHAAKYHILLLKLYPNAQQASRSWNWLFDHTETHFGIFSDLQNLVIDTGEAKYYYHFALLAEAIDRYEVCADFMFASAELSFNKALVFIEDKVDVNEAIRLQLGILYQNSPAEGNYKKAIKQYKKLAFDGNKKAVYQLEVMAQKDNSVLALVTLAEIYENYFSDIKKTSGYHMKIISLSSQKSYGVTSLDWLFKNASVSDEVFCDLHELVIKSNEKQLDYKFGLLAGKKHKIEISKQYIIKSAKKIYLPAVNWIVKNSQNDTELMLELADIYDKFNNPEDTLKSLKIYEELAIANNQTAIRRLDVLARVSSSAKAMNILAEIYVSESNHLKAANYYLLIVKQHPNLDMAKNSWDWLFNNAENNEKIFIKIKSFIDQINSIDMNYRMAELLDKMGDINNAADYYLSVIGCKLEFVNKKYSWDWILHKSENNEKILTKLECFIDNHNDVEIIYKTACFFEKINYINRATDYHYRIISVYPESNVAKYSWDWLFYNAKTDNNAFVSLKNVVDKLDSADINYHMVKSLEEIGNHALATEYAVKNFLRNHSASEDWLIKRAGNINHPARGKVLALYAEYSRAKFKQVDIYPYFMESILNEDKKAFKNLEYIAENSDEYQAIWLLSLCYQHGICVEKNHQKSYYYLKIADGHMEEARYNLDVMTYGDMRKKYPLTYEARLFINPLITNDPPLFADQGSLRYMFYLSLLTPEFISFDEREPSYSVNYMTWLMPIFLIVLLAF